MARPTQTLAKLAEALNCELKGNPDCAIDRVAALDVAGVGAISFLANSRYRGQLADTKASAVILPSALADESYPFSVLFSANPYYTFARIAQRLNPPALPNVGVAASAVIDQSAQVAASSEIGARVVVGAGARIGERCVIAPGCVIEADCQIGDDVRLAPNVTVHRGTRIGDRVIVHAGAVLGGDGFGFAFADDHWEPVPQLGSLVVEADVSIGANTTIDRGSQGTTLIEIGCKIDNLVQIGHNVRLGAHTVIASGTGISGSTRIGRFCTIGGQVGFAGHLEIAEGSMFTGQAMVTGNIREPGVYSSGIPAAPQRSWRKNAVRFGQLDTLARRLDRLERAMTDTEEDNA